MISRVLMDFKKYKRLVNITKKKQTHKHIENKLVVAGGRGLGRRNILEGSGRTRKYKDILYNEGVNNTL